MAEEYAEDLRAFFCCQPIKVSYFLAFTRIDDERCSQIEVIDYVEDLQIAIANWCMF
jgi:hypothetical protein